MITEITLKDFLKNAPEEYIKVYEERFKKVAMKAFIDGCYTMAEFMESDGNYTLEWSDPETFMAIKLANDIDNAKDTPLSFNHYQDKAMMTCMPSCDNFSYMILNLVGEVGEFASKVAKDIRKCHANIDNCNLWIGLERTEDEREARNMELMHEAGDILWQLAGLCHVMGWSLEDVAKANLNKLASRKQRGVIDGDGDNR